MWFRLLSWRKKVCSFLYTWTIQWIYWCSVLAGHARMFLAPRVPLPFKRNIPCGSAPQGCINWSRLNYYEPLIALGLSDRPIGPPPSLVQDFSSVLQFHTYIEATKLLAVALLCNKTIKARQKGWCDWGSCTEFEQRAEFFSEHVLDALQSRMCNCGGVRCNCIDFQAQFFFLQPVRAADTCCDEKSMKVTSSDIFFFFFNRIFLRFATMSRNVNFNDGIDRFDSVVFSILLFFIRAITRNGPNRPTGRNLSR